MNPCIFPDCTGAAYSRGLCYKHYAVARGMIKSGKTTWAELETKNKANKPSKTRSNQTQQWFLS